MIKSLLLAAVSFISISCQKDLEDYEKSIVKLYVSKQSQDFESPWLQLPTTYGNYLGVVTSKGILTSAQSVIDSQLIQIELLGDSGKYPTTVIFADLEANLALLSIPKNIQKKLKKLKIDTTELDLDERYKFLYLKGSTQAAVEKVSIDEVSLENVASTMRSQTVYSVSFDKNSILRGEVLLNEGKVAGLSVGKTKDRAYVIPGFTLDHFMRDSLDGNYRGFPGLAVVAELIRDKVRLESMGLDSGTKGLIVSHVLAKEVDESRLIKDDVILSIDGHKLDELGQVNHSVWGKISYKHLFDRKYGGDSVQMVVLRNTKKLKLKFTLDRFSSNIAMIRTHSTPRDAFLIEGGLVFQELSLEYLKVFGSKWYKKAPLHLLYLYQVDNYLPENLGERRIILNKVLPDQVNRGYSSMRNLVVAKVNNQKVKSIQSLKDIIANSPVEKGGKKYLVVEFADTKETIVLDYDRIAQSKGRIQKTYLN